MSKKVSCLKDLKNNISSNFYDLSVKLVVKKVFLKQKLIFRFLPMTLGMKNKNIYTFCSEIAKVAL